MTIKINNFLEYYNQERFDVIKAQKKCQYALRAVFELARHKGKGPVKISQIARSQAIPVRFLEVILGQLKNSGMVEAKRGYFGGYQLIRDPAEISVGEIFRHMRRQAVPDRCIVCISGANCPFHGNCAFASMWNRVNEAVKKIYNEITIEDLLEEEKQNVLYHDMVT